MLGTVENSLLRHGYALLASWVFLEQIGLPLPAAPVLMAAGAIAGTGRLSLLGSLIVAVFASLVADFVWFHLGKRRGTSILGLLCRLSLKRDSCARRTENVYAKHGFKSLLVAKFIPGLSTAAPPVAGAFGMRGSLFLLFDGLGSLLWAGAFLVVGYLFSSQFEDIARLVEKTSAWLAIVIVVGALVAYVINRHLRRRQFVRSLQMARVSPEELKAKLDKREEVAIVDLRHGLDFLSQPYTIPGAIRIPLEELAQRHQEIPRERDVVLYCTCPSEASSAMAALQLRKLGITRVRPLAGGYSAWKKLGYPLESEFDELTQSLRKSAARP